MMEEAQAYFAKLNYPDAERLAKKASGSSRRREDDDRQCEPLDVPIRAKTSLLIEGRRYFKQGAKDDTLAPGTAV